MEIPLSAIEVTGTVDEHHKLHLDQALPISGPKQVRVIVLFPADDDLDEAEWRQAAVSNPAFRFLHETGEDIYSVEDGNPFHDQV